MNSIKEKLKEIEKEYLELQENIQEYSNGNIKSTDLKKFGAKFGIYEQRNKTMMLRLKAVGGELSLSNLKNLGNIMNTYEIPYLHLSTRQNYQLHEVELTKVKSVIDECNSKEMYFRGGGGNTFRSVLVSTYTGINDNSSFNVMPYAKMIQNEVFFMDKAFDFGRKLKMGLSSDTSDEFTMAVQDMGFLAREVNGQRGFKVFAGGGMGRNSRLGFTLFDFLPKKDLLKAVKSMIELFHEHGDRTNRAKARLRYLVEKLGEDEFSKLFFSYFDKEKIQNGEIKEVDYIEDIKNLKTFDTKTETEGFKLWKEICTKETKFKNISSLTLYVKNGDLTKEVINKLADLFTELNLPFVRATIDQNLVLPLIHDTALLEVFNFLKAYIPQIVTESFSLEGQIRACVGSQICPMGIQPSPVISKMIADKLDKLTLEFPEYKTLIFKEARNIRISGCPSSCAGIPVAPLGFIGTKKKINDVFVDCVQVYTGGILTDKIQTLSSEAKDLVLPVVDTPNFVYNIFKDYIKELETYNLSFAEYMYKRTLNQF